MRPQPGGSEVLRLAAWPAIAPSPPRRPSKGRCADVLSDGDRAQLGAIASLLRVRKNGIIYREGEPADFLYCIAEGVVVSAHSAARGTPYVTAFPHAYDMIGLAREGRYLETARAATSVRLYKIPFVELDTLLHRNAGLAIHLLCKLSHELRDRIYLSALLARKDALGKAAMFIAALDRHAGGHGLSAQLDLPMRRSDIASHLGLTAEALSRAFGELARRGVLLFRGRRRVEIADRGRLNEVIVVGGSRSA